MNIIWKIILTLVGILFAVTLLGFFGPKVASYWREYRYDVNLREAEDMARAIETAYKNDLDGGKTPEETFDLFLTALKASNTLQASKYYELSVQPKALVSLQKELAENGNLQKSIDYFSEVLTKGTRFCNEEGEGCTWEYRYITTKDEVVGVEGREEKFFIPAGSNDKKSVDISINISSGVWKITQPF